MEIIHLLRYRNRLDANVELSSHAMSAFDADQTSDRTSMFLSSYLLHYWFGNPSTYRDAHWWLAASIRSAQCMGYHRSTKNTQMPKAEKARWKRVRDRQTSLSTGTPMVINDWDHDVEALLPEDLADETPETVRYIMAQVELNKAAARLYFAHCSPPRLADSREPSVCHLAMDEVQRTLKSWYDAHPFLDGPAGGHHLALTLKVCYNYYLINLHQRLQRQAPTPTSNPHILDAAANVFSLVDESLLYWSPEHFPMIYISALFSAMMALAVDAAPPEPQGNQLLKTIRPGLMALKQFEPVYVLARWIRSFFMNSFLRRLKVDIPKSNGKRNALISIGLVAAGVTAGLTLRSPSQKTSSTLPLKNTPKLQHDISPANMTAAREEFAAILDLDAISTAQPDLIAHSGTDYQSYAWTASTAITSQVILYPSTTQQVSDLVKICARRRIPITPYSGGTSIEGQYIPHRRGVTIDFSRMSSIVSLNMDDLDCTVQPGLGWVELNEELAPHGLFFPPDPGPGAMIGGMVGTGCSGTNAAAYGTMRDWVLSLTVVLADGTIIKTRQRARKSSAGYDLTRTFVGSEGTLGLVTEATLKLAVRPPHQVVAVCTFPTLRDAAAAARDVVGRGIQVAAVEILDEVQMRNINLSKLTRLRWKEEPTLFFKFAGSDGHIVEHVAKQVGVLTKNHGSTSYRFASDTEEREELWSARKNALWSMLAQKEDPTDKVWTTDVAVPLSRMPEIIEAAKADIDRSGLMGSIVGHVGDGNFHTLLLFPEEKRHIAEGVVHRMIDMAIEMKGTATGEHGIGLVKRDYLEKELGTETVDAMRQMKNAFDPLCLFNCDKVVRMEPSTKEHEHRQH
ncbi:hypothetical protein ACHAQA_004617 [Verticillium albo-atrum]